MSYASSCGQSPLGSLITTQLLQKCLLPSIQKRLLVLQKNLQPTFYKSSWPKKYLGWGMKTTLGPAASGADPLQGPGFYVDVWGRRTSATLGQSVHHGAGLSAQGHVALQTALREAKSWEWPIFYFYKVIITEPLAEAHCQSQEVFWIQ